MKSSAVRYLLVHKFLLGDGAILVFVKIIGQVDVQWLLPSATLVVTSWSLTDMHPLALVLVLVCTSPDSPICRVPTTSAEVMAENLVFAGITVDNFKEKRCRLVSIFLLVQRLVPQPGRIRSPWSIRKASLFVGGEKRDSEEKCLLKMMSVGGGRRKMREVRRPH